MKRWKFGNDWVELDQTGTTWQGPLVHTIRHEIAKSFRKNRIRPETHNVEQYLIAYLDKTQEIYNQQAINA